MTRASPFPALPERAVRPAEDPARRASAEVDAEATGGPASPEARAKREGAAEVVAADTTARGGPEKKARRERGDPAEVATTTERVARREPTERTDLPERTGHSEEARTDPSGENAAHTEVERTDLPERTGHSGEVRTDLSEVSEDPTLEIALTGLTEMARTGEKEARAAADSEAPEAASEVAPSSLPLKVVALRLGSMRMAPPTEAEVASEVREAEVASEVRGETTAIAPQEASAEATEATSLLESSEAHLAVAPGRQPEASEHLFEY